MIKMSEKDTQGFEQNWNEARECFFLIKLKKAKIVVVRERGGREYRYTRVREGSGCRG